MERFDPSESLPEQIRVSLGSAVVLGLAEARLDVAPTTVYIMTYRQEKCTANCGFCPQAKGSNARADMLSRVSWPAYRTLEVQKGIIDAAHGGRIRRVCIQALNYPQVFNELYAIVRAISQSARVPISVSCQPQNVENMRQLANAGVERIGIPLDAATEELFDRMKGFGAGGTYDWKKQWELLKHAKKIYGEGKVSTHLIVGLGETDEKMVGTIQKCVDLAVLPALFAFTPIPGTPLGNKAQPQIKRYRRIQTARHLILHRIVRCKDMSFDGNGSITDFGVGGRTLRKIIQTGEPFLTSGCPDCNRPFYNEKPSGPIYNFPRKLTPEEVSVAKKQLNREQEG
jgi:biotin synthase-related radical SAM superfamily protein